MERTNLQQLSNKKNKHPLWPDCYNSKVIASISHPQNWGCPDPICRIGIRADMGIFPLIGDQQFWTWTQSRFLFLRQSTICDRTQTRMLCYSGKPLDKMSAVWKKLKLESESSLKATCNICNMIVSWGENKRAAFNTTKYYREGN